MQINLVVRKFLTEGGVEHILAGTSTSKQRRFNVDTTSHDVVSTLKIRCYKVVSMLGCAKSVDFLNHLVIFEHKNNDNKMRHFRESFIFARHCGC